MTTDPAQCLFCTRLHQDPKAEAPRTCEAYPDGIPGRVLRNVDDHRRPLRGDKGLRFVARDAQAAADADLFLRGP